MMLIKVLTHKLFTNYEDEKLYFHNGETDMSLP